MNFKNLIARLTGAEADIKELKKIRGLAAKYAQGKAEDEKDEEEIAEGEEDPKEDEDKEKSGKSESEEDKENEGEGEDEEDPEKDKEEDEDEPSASALFESIIGECTALRAENKRLRAENSSEGRTKQVNAEATRLIVSAGRKAPVKTKVSGGSNAKKTVTRAELNQMSPAARKAFTLGGGRITD